MEVRLHNAAAADLPVVKNLVPYYIYDMSEHMGWACKPDGQFGGCDSLESYFSDAGKFAFIFRAGDEPAGFALILGDNGVADVDYSVTDFFILRKFRGQGVGERIARELFDRFPGRWKVEQFAQQTRCRILAKDHRPLFTRRVHGIFRNIAVGRGVECDTISQWNF